MAGVLTEASSAQDASEPQFAVEAHIDSFKYTSAEKSAAAQTPTLHAPDAVLHDVHLCIKRGSLTVLTGLSGCGKTTLLRLICRLYPDFFEGTLQGSVRVLGRDTHEYAPGEMATCLGLVFQDPRSQFLSTIVEDEIALTGENLGIEREELQKRVEQILAFLGITHLKHRSVLELSGGERQKVAIASVLVSQPDVIVMDEPSASLDYASTLQLAQMLVKLKQAGKTIIVAEHRLFYLTHILDQLVVMQEGTVEGVYEPEQLHQDLAQRLHLRAFDEKTLVAQAATPVTPKLDADVQTKVTAQTAQGTETIPAIGVSREYVRGLDVFVSHHFWKRTQLMQGVGFDLLQGQVLAVVGSNGVGKSTLAKQLCGLIAANTSLVTSWGNNGRTRNAASFYVMQEAANQIFFESVEEELLQGRRDKRSCERAAYLLKKIDLWEQRLEHPQMLSGGEQQRLVVGAALMEPHKLIVFDEPTAGLDYKRMSCLAELIAVCAQTSAVMVITHDTELIMKACTHCLLCDAHDTHMVVVSGNEQRIHSFMAGA